MLHYVCCNPVMVAAAVDLFTMLTLENHFQVLLSIFKIPIHTMHFLN